MKKKKKKEKRKKEKIGSEEKKRQQQGKNHGKNEIRSSKYDLSVQRQYLHDVYGLQYSFFLSVLISLLEENRKTSESIFFILIFGLFRTAKQTIKRNFHI